MTRRDAAIVAALARDLTRVERRAGTAREPETRGWRERVRTACAALTSAPRETERRLARSGRAR